MAEDESDVLLAASADEKSDWILELGSAYHLCRDREMFSAYTVYEGLVRITNNTANRVVGNRVVGEGTIQFRMENGRFLTFTEVRRVPSL